MKRFRFRFERLEGLHMQQERLARSVLAEATARRDAAVRDRDRMLVDIESCIDSEPAAAPLARALEQGLRTSLPAAEHRIALAESAVHAAERKWRDTRQQSRTYERLREKQWQAWRRDSQREEQAQIDEMTTIRTAGERARRRRGDRR